MKRVAPVALGFLGALLLFAGWAPGAVAARPTFYESLLLGGDAADFDGNGALDLADVYAAEVSPYILETDYFEEQVVIRIEPRALSDVSYCMVEGPRGSVTVCHVRYDVHFRAAGKDHDLFAVVEPPLAVAASNAEVRLNDTSVKFLLNRTDRGLLPGTLIERFYVTSQLISNGQAQPADRAPGDNENMPYDRKPEIQGLFAPEHRLAGTYPFFRVELLTPSTLPSADGSSVEFRMKITPSPGVSGDSVYIRWDSDWSLVPSRGATGAFPYGLLTGLEPGVGYDFDFTASPRDLVERGETHPIPTRLHSSSQGHVLLPLAVKITGPAFEDPDHVFRLISAPSLRAGSPATLHFVLVDAEGAPKAPVPIDVHFRRPDGRLVATVAATSSADGYRVTYTFPTPGAWTVEPVLADTVPSPHGLFTVQVASNGSPGPDLLIAGGVLVALAAIHRSRRHNGF